jgi:hypothetical protein
MRWPRVLLSRGLLYTRCMDLRSFRWLFKRRWWKKLPWVVYLKGYKLVKQEVYRYENSLYFFHKNAFFILSTFFYFSGKIVAKLNHLILMSLLLTSRAIGSLIATFWYLISDEDDESTTVGYTKCWFNNKVSSWITWMLTTPSHGIVLLLVFQSVWIIM